MFKKLILLILIAFVSYFALTIYFQPQIKKVLRVSEPASTPSSKNGAANIIYDCQKDKSAFDILKERSRNVGVTEYPFGKLVEAIDGVRNGTDGKYWTFFIDDKLASTSADNYNCKDKEKIEWKFGKENQ